MSNKADKKKKNTKKYANQLKNVFVVSVCSSTLTMNLAFSPLLNLELNRAQQLSYLLLR
jgi:hypothetical protein